MSDRRFIEESFPVKEVGEASAREKNIRHGHISTLHPWWSRKPLAASRATVYAALTDAPDNVDDWHMKRDFITQLSQWDNTNNPLMLEKARKDILETHARQLSKEYGRLVSVEDIESGKFSRPRVLDPFAGGGSYPLEALRMGCKAYANDYNPVAILIEKAILEYPQKFGYPFKKMPEWALPQGEKIKGKVGKSKGGKGAQPSFFEQAEISDQEPFNPLFNAVCYWGEWVLNEVRKELIQFYPLDPDGSIPVGYLWARTIPCQNPICGKEIPLKSQYWLAQKENKRVALYPELQGEKITFRIVGDGYDTWPEGFDADNGTVSHAIVTCPFCGTIISDDTTRQLFLSGASKEEMIAVILQPRHGAGKNYRPASVTDKKTFEAVAEALNTKRDALMQIWGLDPIPDESIPTTELRRISPPLYGMLKWSSLYNQRQLLALVTIAEKIRRSYELMEESKADRDFSVAVVTYLGMNLDRLATYCCSLGYWHVTGEKASPAMQRQSLAFVFDYVETNPLADNYSWSTNLEWVTKVLEHLNRMIFYKGMESVVLNHSATQFPVADNYFDAVLTDPPYYDNVPYSHLADFFYVWLKRSVGYLYPELFSTPLTPKSQEIVQDRAHSHSPSPKTKEYFEQMLTKSFREIHRILKPDGISVIVYAHKSTEGWETLINSLLDSQMIITGAWPVHTEMESRMNARDTASLASSIYIVARKMPRQPTGFYNDVRTELRQHLDTKLHRLWEEGIGGADFFIAAIGSAIEVFGKYEQVMDYEGTIVRANRLLEEVRTIATDYAVRQILHNGFASEISGLTRLYVLWRWNYGEALVPFDEGRKLAQSCGIDLANEWGKGFVKKEKEFVRLLGPQNRKLEELDDPRDLVDVLHKALLLWEKGQRGAMIQALADRGYGKSEAFYRVAQAISETLPLESKEKKLLDGFLAGRERVQDEVEKAGVQGRLWE